MTPERFAKRVRMKFAEQMAAKGLYPKKAALDALEQSTRKEAERKMNGNRKEASRSSQGTRSHA